MFLLLKNRFFPNFVQTHGSRVQKVHFRMTCVVQKRRCLRFSLKQYRKWNLFISYEGNFQHHFVCLFLVHRSHRNCPRVSHAMGQFFSMEQPHHWKRLEGIQLRSPTPIIANVTAIGTRTPSHECQEPITVNVYFPGPGCLKDG